MRKFTAAITLLFISIALFAAQGANIRGKVVDSRDKTALAEATVRLLRANSDSTFVTGAAADDKGSFVLSNVRPGRYILCISYLGYETAYESVNMSTSTVNVGEIALKGSTVMLKETTVRGIKTEIVVKEDTIEYNADSYLTQPNAVVEDLLKRLPGVEVDSEGKITAQGKEVSKILLDGKEFFADDPKVASKNIPVSMVDKIQVIDRKSDLAQLTGVDDGEDETVINLTVKEGMNNGWFGTVTGGYGTDDRYTGSFMVNYFKNGNQFSLLGGANNTNEMAFTDGGSSRFTRFGGEDGINTSQSIGLNFNVGNEDKFRVGGSVMYSHSDRDTYSNSSYEYLLSDGNTYNDSYSSARDKGHNIRGDFRMKWEIDSCNTLDFRPNFSFNFSNSLKTDSSLTRNSALEAQSRSISSYKNSGDSYEFGGELVFNHKFNSHPGRSFSTQLRYKFSDVTEDGSTYTNNTYYLVDDDDDSDEVINQVYENHRWSNTLGWRLTWTEPLGNVKNARFLTFAYRGEYKWNNADKFVYDIDDDSSSSSDDSYDTSLAASLRSSDFTNAIATKYSSIALRDANLLSTIVDYELSQNMTLNEDQSSSYRSDYFTQSYRLGFKQVRKLYNIDAGLSVNSSMMKSHDLINDERDIDTRWTWNVAPFARLRFKFSTARNLAIDYRANYSEPSISQLQPVADESNPLRITIGNPDLKSTFTQRVNIRYNDFNQEAQRSVMGMLSAQYATNSIVSKVEYDSETGGQTTTYTNVNGVWSANAMGMISFPFTRKTWYFNAMGGLTYSSTVGYNDDEYNRSGTLSVNVAPGISFRPENFELEIRPSYRLQTTNNSSQSSNDQTIHTYGGSLNSTYYTPFGIVLNTDLNFSATSGYSDGYNTRQWLWNAALSYEFLKDKAATVTVKVFDILQQRQSIRRNVTANYIQDLESNTLGRYCMLTFTYKFTTFGSQKDNPQIDDGGFGRRGGPPGGGSGGGPGGPPPGH